jgi:hypothetical protein
VLPIQGGTVGPVFAFYVADREPVNRETENWDELDFEFFYNPQGKDQYGNHFPSTTNSHVWTNMFHNKGSSLRGDNGVMTPMASKDWSRLCIKWAGNWAALYQNGQVIRSFQLEAGHVWRNDMRGYMSIWGADIPDWNGVISQNFFGEAHAYVHVPEVRSDIPGAAMVRSNLRSNFCLDLPGGNTGNGALLNMRDCYGEAWGRWRYETATKRLINLHSGKCMDALGFRTDNGAPVGQWDCSSAVNQRWTWDGGYQLIGEHSGKYHPCSC